MFGHDDHNKTANSTAPVINPTPDDLLEDVHAPAPSGPAFDTSAVSLGSPAPAAPAAPTADDQDLLPAHGAADDDLINIKQDALHQLTPLVGHLEQTPEEKFKTTMMMIQASDDQSLVKTAYEAAQAITDDKVRAQALLDIINEINYFTQQAASN